jgi:hypothetical protein
MTTIIAAFRSRTVTMQVFSALSLKGVPCSLVSTPREAGVGCGMSVQFPAAYLNIASYYASKPTFAGFFRVTIVNGKRIVTRV